MEYWMKRGFSLQGVTDTFGSPSNTVYVVTNGIKSAVVVVKFDGSYQKSSEWFGNVHAAKNEAVALASM